MYVNENPVKEMLVLEAVGILPLSTQPRSFEGVALWLCVFLQGLSSEASATQHPSLS